MMQIDFNTIHGRALAQLVSSKFLKNQGLGEKYAAWIATKPTAKFTGFVPELVKNMGVDPNQNQVLTFNAQFNGLVETAKKGVEQSVKFITVIDTSDSMNSQSVGIDLANIYTAKSMGLFFAEMLDKGPFASSWYEFSDKAKMHKIKGTTPYEKWVDINQSRECCSTNFQAVVEHFCNIKKQNPSITEDQFPNGFLVLSDMEFNIAHLGYTNTEVLFAKFLAAGFSQEFCNNFKIVFWNLASKLMATLQEGSLRLMGMCKTSSICQDMMVLV